MFAGKSRLNEHVAYVHEGKKPFKCETCQASFADKRNLKSHVSVVHEGKKAFKCSVCNAEFTLKSPLNTHMATIHGGKKSTCNICGATFRRNHHLKVKILKSNFETFSYICSKRA